ncbi:MAG: hypothetical protein E7K47_13540 [Acidovorax sp.]|nr:hypothetical protein [Acidovorax sp.]
MDNQAPGEGRMAIAAHLHVLLRRKTARVTDIEWMAANAEYAEAIVRFARQRGLADGAPELVEWADKLAHAMGAGAAPAQQPQQLQPALVSRPARAEPVGVRYVGGLR